MSCSLPSAPCSPSRRPRRRPARVSDEHSYTRTAVVRRVAVFRARPRADSRIVARLHRWTEDRWAEVYLLLRSRERVKGHRWIEIRLPGRPNGATGWFPADALRRPRLTRLAVVVDGLDLGSGCFAGARRVDAPGGDRPPASGVRDERALAALRVAGRQRRRHHGTDQPALVPGRPSHGWIRPTTRTSATWRAASRSGRHSGFTTDQGISIDHPPWVIRPSPLGREPRRHAEEGGDSWQY